MFQNFQLTELKNITIQTATLSCARIKLPWCTLYSTVNFKLQKEWERMLLIFSYFHQGEIKAHKYLLSLVSEVFRAQFFGKLAKEGCRWILVFFQTNYTKGTGTGTPSTHFGRMYRYSLLKWISIFHNEGLDNFISKPRLWYTFLPSFMRPVVHFWLTAVPHIGARVCRDRVNTVFFP